MLHARFALSTFALCWASTAFCWGQAPLHKRIDQLVLAARGSDQPASLCSDATFARRVYLDFAGRIPQAAELRAFLTDKRPDKRRVLIDKLLQSDSYAERMKQLFHVLLMERRGDDGEWLKFLQASFLKNKPWDQLVREILNPDAESEATRGAAFFYTKRLEKYGQNPTDYPGLTRDVARLFLGRDLQCAQCHDHLFIKDYRQVDFQGLYTVYLNVGIRRGVKFPAVTEKPHTMKLEFVSVFDPTKNKTAPRLPTGKEASIPPLPKKDATKKKPKSKKDKAPEPGLRALAWLARELPRSDNPQFTHNVANRLWWIMMGRGLVHPLDLQHSENLASHPQLLELLGREFVSHKFDIKWFLRELALTETYQRASYAAGKLPPADRFLVAIQRRLSPEQLTASLLQATGPWPSPAKKTKDAKQPTEGDKIAAFRKAMLAAFANQARDAETEVRSTVKGALFLSNSEEFLQLLRPAGNNLMARMQKIKDPAKLADELFATILSRPPSQDERQLVVDALNQGKDRTKSIRQVAWAMFCSVEFYVNH